MLLLDHAGTCEGTTTGALLPDAAHRYTVSRVWTGGERISVEVDQTGLPSAVQWRGAAHPVQSIANHWRVDEEWWKQRIWRDYFKLTTHTGLLITIYHDLLYGQWYLFRLYD